ncbi:hypothetical protein KP509_17G007500 [Ceratopteris richardii]|uniref:Uncharacterized protein n=1 Tax=Ceratopteris richardii TaxID=49495 RepID=A0A8T2STF4_CERRI|nr:hypothetical protein KP509_17G007500 [Ceratopteris richardii]
MVSSASSTHLLTVLPALVLAFILSSEGALANYNLRAGHPFLQRHHMSGPLRWQNIRTMLREEERSYILETLQELERKLPHDEWENQASDVSIDESEEDDAKQEESEENRDGEIEAERERHPADLLLERHQADATISYILGGY